MGRRRRIQTVRSALVGDNGAITADRYRERHLVWPEEIELVERRVAHA